MILFELSLALGFAHPRYLLQALTSQEVTEWLVFYKYRPFGFVRESMLFGTLAAQQYGIHKTRGRDRTWKDFFPVDIHAKGADGKDSDEKIISLFKAYNEMRGYT